MKAPPSPPTERVAASAEADAGPATEGFQAGNLPARGDDVGPRGRALGTVCRPCGGATENLISHECPGGWNTPPLDALSPCEYLERLTGCPWWLKTEFRRIKHIDGSGGVGHETLALCSILHYCATWCQVNIGGLAATVRAARRFSTTIGRYHSPNRVDCGSVRYCAGTGPVDDTNCSAHRAAAAQQQGNDGSGATSLSRGPIDAGGGAGAGRGNAPEGGGGAACGSGSRRSGVKGNVAGGAAHCDDCEGFYCDLCEMWLNGPIMLADHKIGKQHKKNIKLRERLAVLSEVSPAIPREVMKHVRRFF